MNDQPTPVRVGLRFSLRIDAADAPPGLRTLVEKALGGQFKPRQTHGLFLNEMYLLGMTIHFLAWRGIGLKAIFQLTGSVAVLPGHQPEGTSSAIDLNQAVIDLLQARGAGTWHAPTPEEIDAETSVEASNAMERDDF